MLVPCVEIVSKMYLLSKLVPKGYNCLLTGASGTGKSSLVKKLIGDLDIQKYSNIVSILITNTEKNEKKVTLLSHNLAESFKNWTLEMVIH